MELFLCIAAFWAFWAGGPSGALLLTLLSGAAQVFPPRMLAAAAVGAAAGALFGEYGKKRGALPSGMRAAARVYEISAALACAEQAL